MALDVGELTERLGRSSTSSKSNARVEPIVHHHGTMTSIVPFREVCKAIKEVAFENNNLPLIISLEVGAEKEQQEMMVEIMQEEWGDLLLQEPIEGCDPTERQPRLDELLNKILIKVKPLETPTPTPTSETVVVERVERGRSGIVSSIRQKPPICEALAKLAVYTQSKHFDDQQFTTVRTPSHIFSVSEDNFCKLALDSKKLNKLLVHNRNFFMRIYPKGLRVDSSNPDPALPWRRGVQMVAMNWQKTDQAMMCNDAMFSDTKGWVLKPPGFLSDDPGDFHEIPRKNVGLRITVLAGQNLPLPEDKQLKNGGDVKPKFRPQVKVELHVERLNKSQEYEAETKPKDGENPDWGHHGSTLEFLGVNDIIQELSFVR